MQARTLVSQVSKTIIERYELGRHQIASGLLAADGAVFEGVHVEAMVGRASICAESVSLGNVVLARCAPLVLAVAIRHSKPTEPGPRLRVVPPCGLCREVLYDYAPELGVVLGSPEAPHVVPIKTLLPHKYVGTKW